MLLPLHLNLDGDSEPALLILGCVHATHRLAATVSARAALSHDVDATARLAGALSARAYLSHDVAASARLAGIVTVTTSEC